MPYVFAAFAVGQLLVIVITAVVGYLKIDPNGDRHVLLGVLAILLSCLLQVFAFTYLIIVGKTIAQACHLANLPADRINTAQGMKRPVLRLLMVIIVVNLLATITGARHWQLAQSSTAHLLSVLALFAVHAIVLFRQYHLIYAAHHHLARTMLEYEQVRKAPKQTVAQDQ